MSNEEISKMVDNTIESAYEYGIYQKICLNCNKVVGGRLAEYGKPDTEELSKLCCPYCGNGIGEKQHGFYAQLAQHGKKK